MRLKKSTSKNNQAKKQTNNSRQRKKNPRTIRVYFAYIKVAAFLVLSIAIFIVSFFSNYPSKFYESLLQGVYAKSSRIGFQLKEIVVQGRSKTEQDSLLKAINIKRGDPILAINLEELRLKIEKLEWIRSATVIRQLPDILYIKIIERSPIAIWQNNQKKYLIDSDGTPIHIHNQQNDGKLPLVVGEGAPLKTPEILEIIKKYPKISENLTALCRIRERRWNLFLTGNVIVKLSDDHLKDGLITLEKLIDENRITNDVKEIDLRTNDRFFVKVTPDVIEKIKNSRKGKKT